MIAASIILTRALAPEHQARIWGLRKAGLNISMSMREARKPLAFVAYGLQPPGKWSRIRVGKLRRAYERNLDMGKDEVERGQ